MMADSGSSHANAAMSSTQASSHSQSSGPQSQRKRKPRTTQRDKQIPNIAQTDGAASDPAPSQFSGSQSGNRNKPRQQSVAMGALPNGNFRTTQQIEPKQRPVSIGANTTPLKEQAYAGPTFQASPAPSSLPVPKFASRSVPNVAAHKSLETRTEGLKASKNEESSPEPDIVSPLPPRESQHSPLDFFFKAQQAEKQKSRSPSVQDRSAASPSGAPATAPGKLSQRPGKSLFLSELDGDDEDVPSSRNVPQNRHAVDMQPQNSPSRTTLPPSDGQDQSGTYTQGLKDLLFNSGGPASPGTSTPPQAHRLNTHSHSPANAYQAGSPYHRSPSGPSTPVNSQQNNYSLHYGNRNLSPLFHATKHDTSPGPKPSNLRQQSVPGDMVNKPDYNSDAAVDYQNRRQTQRQPNFATESNNFTRNYLNQTIRDHPSYPVGQSLRSPPPYHGAPPSSSPSMFTTAPPQQRPPPHPPQHPASPSNDSPRAGSASQDIRSMEDDLRKMLNLNVLSN